MTEDSWFTAVLASMERLVGREQTAKMAADWAEHAARDKVEVTFLGPYSSGKSTLLRRLVVDGGVEVPEWLTVSARRETFELNAVDVGDLTFTDAPGFAAGNDLHDELARDALALSDAFLLVVPPQLLTTNRELVGSIVSGGYFFGEPRAGGDRSIIAVIAQADSMGIDPDDDVQGMLRLGQRKRSELTAQLEDASGVSMPDLRVFCVAADPYEEQARQAQPRRSAFDSFRGWDGVDALTDALTDLSAHGDELRRAAQVRYFSGVGRAVASQAETVIDELQASAEELRARLTAFSQLKIRVDGVVDAAKADLQAILVNLAGTLSEELGGDESESRSQIDERMASAIDKWAQRWDGEIDLVLGEAKVQVDDRLGRPRAKRTEEFLRSITAEPTKVDTPDTNSRVVDLLNGTRAELVLIARGSLELFAGESLSGILKDGSRSAAALMKVDLTNATDAAKKAVKAARALEASIEIATAVMTVVTIVDAERRQRELDAQRRRERDEAREKIERNAAIVSVEVVDGVGASPGWRARADVALEALRGQLRLTGDDGAIDELLQTVADRRQQVLELRALLAAGPEDSARAG